MKYFLAINNTSVFDFRAWLASNPAAGYWKFDPKDFEAAEEGDIVFHYVTSGDPLKQGGIHHRFVVIGKGESAVAPDFWAPGKAPSGSTKHVDIDVVGRRLVQRKLGFINLTHLKTLAHPQTLTGLGIIQGANSAQLSEQLGQKIDAEFAAPSNMRTTADSASAAAGA